MILSEKVKITINSSNLKHYTKLYDGIKVFDIIEVNVKDLTKGSHIKIDVRCDECGLEKQIKNSVYHKAGYKDGYWLCKKCKMIKNNQEKYGVDNVFQLDEVKEKIKETVKKKYGVDYISQSEEIQKKIKRNYKKEQRNRMKTVQERYGVDNISQLDEVKEKKENTCLQKYGVKYISQDKNFKEKLKMNK